MPAMMIRVLSHVISVAPQIGLPRLQDPKTDGGHLKGKVMGNWGGSLPSLTHLPEPSFSGLI